MPNPGSITTDSSQAAHQLRIARSTPAGTARLTSAGRWIAYPHLLAINRALVDVAEGRCPRLMVMLPPRHGKSELVSRYFPAWFLGRWPEKKIILTSYEHDFAATWGAKVRDVLLDAGPTLFGIRVAGQAASDWGIERHEGRMFTAGVRGPITGRGADCAIIDDPVKNDEEAFSATYREKTWEWYLSTLSTRLQANGSIILIQTRWHEDDLAGRLIKAQGEGGEKWRVIRFPAVAEEAENEAAWEWTRPAGAPLCPAMFPLETLDGIRNRIGPYWWAALYQGRPSPAGGGIIKREWFRYCRWIDQDRVELAGGRIVPLAGCVRLATVDLAVSTRETADYTVIAAWAYDPTSRDLVLLDVHRARMDGPDILPAVSAMIAKHRLATAWIERTGFQLSVIQQGRREGLPVRELIADKDKVSRAIAATPMMEAGHVYFPIGAPWLGDFEAELLSFPNAPHDDQVDTLSYAAQVVNAMTGVVVAAPNVVASPRDRYSMAGIAPAAPADFARSRVEPLTRPRLME